MFAHMGNPVAGRLTVKEAAVRLGVTPNDVRRLIEAGDLPGARVGRQWLIPTEAVERRRELAPRRGRRMSAPAAWGVLFLAAGLPAPWLTPDARWRAKRRLSVQAVGDLRDRLVDRARTKTYRAHPSMLAPMRVDPDLMLTGVSAASALRLGLVGGPDHLDAYIDQAGADAVQSKYHLRPSHDPNVTLRIVPKIGWDWPPAHVAPRPAVALDLLDNSEPRVRQVGASMLARPSQ